MKNKSLAKDYVIRSEKRLSALSALFKEEAWADTVCESQEVVELCLKGLLRSVNIEVPRIHDVSDLLLEEKDKIPSGLHSHLKKIAKISKTLRRDRELAFYGSEDLTPMDFYKEEDAVEAKESAEWVVRLVKDFVK